jgi:protein ImuB
LSVWFPRLPTDRLTRKSKSAAFSKDPLAVSIKAENALRVHALNAAASRLGLALGQPLANARAMVPHLHVVEADEKADAKLLEGIADWCDRFTPYVALDPPYGLFLDLTGCTHLFGGERPSLDHIRGSIANQGFTVGAGMAGTADAAYALSRFELRFQDRARPEAGGAENYRTDSFA